MWMYSHSGRDGQTYRAAWEKKSRGMGSYVRLAMGMELLPKQFGECHIKSA
jgi:hypothetical protein